VGAVSTSGSWDLNGHMRDVMHQPSVHMWSHGYVNWCLAVG